MDPNYWQTLATNELTEKSYKTEKIKIKYVHNYLIYYDIVIVTFYLFLMLNFFLVFALKNMMKHYR